MMRHHSLPQAAGKAKVRLEKQAPSCFCRKYPLAACQPRKPWQCLMGNAAQVAIVDDLSKTNCLLRQCQTLLLFQLDHTPGSYKQKQIKTKHVMLRSFE